MKIKRLLLLVCIALMLAGCKNKDSKTSAAGVDTSRTPDGLQSENPYAQDIDEEKIPEPVRFMEQNIEYFSSQDGTVQVKIDYNTCSATVIDGDLEFNADITMGHYGTQIEKIDLYNDDDPEYVIIECESTLNNMRQFGLVISYNYKFIKYLFRRFDSRYFTRVLNERVSYEYDAANCELKFVFDEDPSTETVIPFDAKAHGGEFESIDWEDIVYLNFVDKKPWLSVPAGIIYKGAEDPVYDVDFVVSAPIEFLPDLGLKVGQLTGYSSEEQNKLADEIGDMDATYSCNYDLNYDDVEDLITTYIAGPLATDEEKDALTEADNDKVAEEAAENDASGKTESDDASAAGYVRLDLGYKLFDEAEKIRYDKDEPAWMTKIETSEGKGTQVFVTTVEDRSYLVVSKFDTSLEAPVWEYEVFFIGDSCIYRVENVKYEEGADEEFELSDFFDSLYKWINNKSQLLIASDPNLEGGMYYSSEGEILSPDKYYSQKR